MPGSSPSATEPRSEPAAPDPASPYAPTAQELFDASIIRGERIAIRVLAGAAIVAALVLSTIALIVASGKQTTATVMPGPSMHTGARTTVVPVAAAPAPTISLSAAGSSRMGPDGKMHDAFSKTDFTVKVGQPLRLRIDNKDDAAHTITAAATGVNITVRPGVHTYTLLATKAGRFKWVCVLPCDDWAMTHAGYMAGYITAT